MSKQPLSRWQQFYQDDPKLVEIHPSTCARRAAEIFKEHNCHTILDLGCGTGRDSLYLAGSAAQVIGLDAAHSGLSLAQKRAANASTRAFWVESDARQLPLPSSFFDGVYCFGLLHEFVGETAKVDVRRTMDEIHRVLKPAGISVVAAAAGDPAKGLPHVQNFTEAMFDAAAASFYCAEKTVFEDLGCTGRTDYKVWFGHFVKL